MAISGVTPPVNATEPVEIVYSQPADLAVVRDFVRTAARDLGLSEDRADLLTIAVSELATNTLQHTHGAGRVRVQAAGGRIRCEVIDGGARRQFGRSMPAAHELRGRGLAIVERVCDDVEVIAEADGTHVRLTMDR
jgi:serine/threonine-protein kinase RsbW